MLSATHRTSAATVPDRRQRGFSLMEVLVAMLVLAIGLLGLAALQAQGLRFNNEAYSRTQATSLAYEIIDLMRADRDNASAYLIEADALDALSPDPDDVACNPTLVTAAASLTCWIESLRAALPQAQGSITVNPGNANYYDVTVSWMDRELSSDTLSASGDLIARTQGRCEAISGRSWDGGVCRVNQIWTVYP